MKRTPDSATGLRNWLLGPPGPSLTGGGTDARPDLVTVMMESIGREHSGKTALRTCYYAGPLAGPQASGLELAAADPRVMTGWMLDALETYRQLNDRGLTSTINPEETPYHLYFADEPRAVFHHREVVGQILTHTTPDSDDRQQELYQRYVNHLTRADVLQVVVGCPATGGQVDLARFQADLATTAGYLREALRVRPADATPVAVQLLLAKVDVPFPDPAAARDGLADERLAAMLGRLVRIVEGSAKVGMAAVFPVSAFGFGTTVSAEEIRPPADPTAGPAGGFSVVSQGEAEYLLKPGVAPEPFNLTAAVWWAIMAGLMLKPADHRGPILADTVRLMAADLEAMDAWFLPLKGVRPV